VSIWWWAHIFSWRQAQAHRHVQQPAFPSHEVSLATGSSHSCMFISCYRLHQTTLSGTVQRTGAPTGVEGGSTPTTDCLKRQPLAGAMRRTEPAKSTVKGAAKNLTGRVRRRMIVHLAGYWPLLLLRIREYEEEEERLRVKNFKKVMRRRHAPPEPSRHSTSHR
jgi:hypothetical protein